MHTKVTAPALLGKAEQHMRDRAATYDSPEGERSMARAVAVFNALHDTSLTEAQGWNFMALLKMVRLFTRPEYHADSAEDAIAYLALMAEARAKACAPMASEPEPAPANMFPPTTGPRIDMAAWCHD